MAEEGKLVKTPSRCAVCDTYDMKSLWKCDECEAMNVSKDESCWKCKVRRPRRE